MSGNERITAKQERAIAVLISENSVVSAAAKMRVSEITLRR